MPSNHRKLDMKKFPRLMPLFHCETMQANFFVLKKRNEIRNQSIAIGWQRKHFFKFHFFQKVGQHTNTNSFLPCKILLAKLADPFIQTAIRIFLLTHFVLAGNVSQWNRGINRNFVKRNFVKWHFNLRKLYS